MKDFRQMVDTYVLDREKHKKYLAFVLALSMMVTFAVPLSLMQPAESMTANREFLGTELARAQTNASLHPVSCTDPNCTNDAHEYSEVELLVGQNPPDELKGATTVDDAIDKADRAYALGIASQFCVFVEGNFTAYGSDTEGRIAAGGIINATSGAGQYEAGNGDHGSRISLDRLLSNYGYSHIIANTSINNFYTYTWNDYKYIYENGDYSKEGKLFKRIWIDYDTVYDYDERNYSHYSDIDDHFYRSSESGGFDVAAEFEELVNRSKKLSEKPSTNSNAENSGISIVPLSNGSNKVVFDAGMLGQTQDVVVFNCSSDFWMNNVKQCQVFEFKNIPNLSEPRSVVQVEVGVDGKPTTVDKTWEYAYIVINVGGDPGGMIRVTDESVACTINDVLISKDKIGSNGGFEGVANEDYVRNNHYGVTSLLYNFYDAGEVELGKNFQGTIFAPNADAHDLANRDGNGELKKNDKGEFESSGAGHLSGALIAKSFWGKTEFGYRPYTGPISILGSTSGYTIPVDKFESDGSTPLPGAAFKLTITDQDDNVVTSWTSGDSTEYVTIPTMIDFTGGVTYTDAQDADPKNDLVQTRSYTVKEESAPEGYIKTEKTYTLIVEETINKDTLLPAEGGGTIPRDVEVTITITSDTGENLLLPTFTISDEYSEDAQTMRKIKIGETIYFLNMQDGKVKEVNKSVGESSVATTDIAHVYTTSIGGDALHKYTIPIEVETGTTILTDVEVPAASTEAPAVEPDESDADESGTDTAETTSTETTTATSATTSIWTDIMTTISTSVEVSTEGTTYTEIETSTTAKSSYTTYTTVAVLNSEEAKTEGTVTEPNGSETKTYYFDPNSLMFMPLPANNLEFVNEYGFLFKKVDEGGDPVTGATIVLEQQTNEPDTGSENGNIENDGYAVIKVITESSITIDPNLLTTGVLYRFRESVVPNGYEAADPIYFKKSDDVTILQRTSADGTGGTELKLDSTNDRTIKMEDRKIHGAELFLYKVKAGEPSVKLTNAKFELYRMGVAEVLDTFTIPKEGLDLTQRWAVFDTAYIKKGYLTPGSYYLKEIVIPEESGYAENSGNEYHFTVKPDFSIELGKKESVEIKLDGGSSEFVVSYPDANQHFIKLDKSSAPLEGITSVQIAASEQPRIYVEEANASGGYEKQLIFNSELNVYEWTFDSPVSLKTFKILEPSDSWNGDIKINSVKIVTTGLQYVYGSNNSRYETKSDTVDLSAKGMVKDKVTNINGVDYYPYSISIPNLGLQKADGSAVTALSGYELRFKNSQSHTGIFNNQKSLAESDWGWDSFSGSSVSCTQNVLTMKFLIPVSEAVEVSDIECTVYWQEEAAETEDTSSDTATSDIILTPDANSNVNILSLPNEWGTHTSISVKKTWDVAGYVEFIPEDLTLTLYRKTENSGWENVDHATPTLTKQDTIWNYKYEKLPGTAENGSTYYYKVEEQVPAGFEKTKDTNPQNGIESGDIELTNKLKTVLLNAQKKWECPKGTTLPNSITISLEYSKDGTEWKPLTGSEQVLNAGNSWKYAYDAVPAGYYYRIVENTVLRGWQTTAETSTDKVTADGTALTITNKLSTGGLKIVKNWDGDNESNRPDKITVKLYRKAVAGGGSGGNAGGTVSSLNIAKVPISTKKSTGTDVYTDYSRLLQYSLYFYDVNMCGDQVTENSALTWRNDCHLNDEIQGGFHDAGDHVMFGLPQGYTASTLGWSYYEFKDAYDDLGLTGHYQTIMKHFCDFFVASTDLTDDGTSVERVLFQKGVGGDGYDHGYWGDPTNQPDNYNSGSTRSGSMHWIYPNEANGSDFTALYAATLAQYYLNFYDIDPVTADKYLSYAEKLYAFAKINPGVTRVGQYNDNNDYKDDMAWAAGWLYLATEKNTYKNDLSSSVNDWTYCWSDVSLGAASMYGHINNDWSKVTSFLDGKCNNPDSYYIASNWGSARYNAALQMVALVATKNTDKDYTNWCKSQMKIILGANEANTCFVTGFADNSSKYPHHRAASGYDSAEEKGSNTQYAADGKTLVGALVGGPSNGGHDDFPEWHYYYDNMQDYCCNEVALDYNAGLVGAAAGLYHFYKNDADVNKTFSLVTNTDDFGTKSGIETAYPAVVPTAQSLTLTPQQSEKANAIKGIAKVGSDVKAKGTETLTLDQNDFVKSGLFYEYILSNDSRISDKELVSIVLEITGTGSNGKASYNYQGNVNDRPEASVAIDSVPTTVTLNIPEGSTPSKLGVQFNYGDGGIGSVVITYKSSTPSTPQFTITPSEHTITEGDTLNLTASGNTNTVQWSCDPSGAVAFNSATGNEVTITAQSVTADTKVTITAKDGDGDDAPAATAEITIKPKDLNFSIDVTQVRVNGGEKTVTLTATPSDNVRFTRSDGIQVTDNVITVNPTEVGELTITATRGGASTTQKIIFVGDPFIEGENTMNVGDNQTLKLQNAIGTVTWALQTASDIVTISDTGEVTALKNGTVTVIATDSYDKKTAEFSITVDLFALDVDTSGMEEVDTLTLTKANDWTYTLQNLPITDEQGNAYVYYIEEVLDPATNTLTTPSAVYVPIDYAGNGIQLEENAGTKEMTVTNKLKSSVETTGQMPDAGGEGNGRYYMAGAAMMLAGIAGYFVLKRRQRSRADA